MQDISELIKEAKPLYFARKKRNFQIKSGLTALACVLFVFSLWPKSQQVDNFSFWDLGYSDTETITYVENFGLPVDDYGLLWVV